MQEREKKLGGFSCFCVSFLVFFAMGTKWYTRYPPEGSLIPRVVKTISTAISNKWNTPKDERKEEHWLDYSSETVSGNCLDKK